MGRHEMIVAIIAIVMLATVLKARYNSQHRRRHGETLHPAEQAETLKLRDEVKELKDRIKVLERITVEKENSLARQIEELRDR